MTLAPRSVARPLEALLVILTLGVLVASALGLLAESFWMFELLTHFRLQFLAVQLPLLVVCLWRRRWVLFAATLPFTVVNAAVVAPYWPRETDISAPSFAWERQPTR